jgi:hypothetical protein
MTQTRKLILALTVVAIVFAAGCSQKYSAERDGKKAGEAVCDLRDASTPEDAQSALDDLNNQMDDLGNKYAMFTSEDRADVQNNLADLHEHVIQGNRVLVNQDLAVLRRSVGNIAEDSGETTRAAWEGIFQGLSSCTE